jgi:outer membrane protein TolC
VVPRLETSLKLIREGYERGSALFTFADELSAQQALSETRLRLADTRRELWRAVADLQGLMYLDLGEELEAPCGLRRDEG